MTTFYVIKTVAEYSYYRLPRFEGTRYFGRESFIDFKPGLYVATGQAKYKEFSAARFFESEEKAARFLKQAGYVPGRDYFEIKQVNVEEPE